MTTTTTNVIICALCLHDASEHANGTGECSACSYCDEFQAPATHMLVTLTREQWHAVQFALTIAAQKHWTAEVDTWEHLAARDSDVFTDEDRAVFRDNAAYYREKLTEIAALEQAFLNAKPITA